MAVGAEIVLTTVVGVVTPSSEAQLFLQCNQTLISLTSSLQAKLDKQQSEIDTLKKQKSVNSGEDGDDNDNSSFYGNQKVKVPVSAEEATFLAACKVASTGNADILVARLFRFVFL